MRPGGVARLPNQGHRLATGHLVSLAHQQLAAMGIETGYVVVMSDLQIESKLIALPDILYHAIGEGADLRPLRRADIQGQVELMVPVDRVVPIAEGGSDGALDRHRRFLQPELVVGKAHVGWQGDPIISIGLSHRRHDLRSWLRFRIRLLALRWLCLLRVHQHHHPSLGHIVQSQPARLAQHRSRNCL